MGSLDDDPVFELVDIPEGDEDGQGPVDARQEDVNYLNAEDGTDRVEE